VKAPAAAKAPAVKAKSAAQVAAGKSFAAAGRATQAASRTTFEKAHKGKKPPVTKARHQAALKWAAAGRATQAAKKSGKVAPKKAAAIAPAELALAPASYWALGGNDEIPDCAAVAVANHLRASTGLVMADENILRLHVLAGGNDDESTSIVSVLEILHEHPGWFGVRALLASFTRTDEEVIVAGLVVRVSLPHAGHAVLSHPQGMVSWGQVLPWAGVPDEAWALEWLA
jgi:hypothetical protein